MPRSLTLVRASMAAALVAVALVGCTQAPEAAPTSSCAGSVAKVLLTDDSATTIATFDAGDLPKIFAITATPAPSCYYKTTSTTTLDGVTYTVVHRTMLYIGLSDSDSAALAAAVRKTTSVAPWTVDYDNGIAAATPAPSAPTPTAPAAAVSSAALWEYNFSGARTDDKGEMGYYAATPLTAGTAKQAGLSKADNVLRIETEFRSPQK